MHCQGLCGRRLCKGRLQFSSICVCFLVFLYRYLYLRDEDVHHYSWGLWSRCLCKSRPPQVGGFYSYLEAVKGRNPSCRVYHLASDKRLYFNQNRSILGTCPVVLAQQHQLQKIQTKYVCRFLGVVSMEVGNILI